MANKVVTEIPYYEFEPFCILEGGNGLEDCEKYFVKSLIHHNIEHWVLDKLYDKPRRLAAVQFLKPKTLILGTTGVYGDRLNQLIDLFFDLDIGDGLENVILTLDSDEVLWGEMRRLKQMIPNVKFWKLYGAPSMFDEPGEIYKAYELEV